MTNGTEKPPIDRDAEAAVTRQEAQVDSGDVPMPTVENEPDCYFASGTGIGSIDVFEIALMFLLDLTNTPVSVAPGGLRTLPLPAHRVAQLSDSARRFMKPVPGSNPSTPSK